MREVNIQNKKSTNAKLLAEEDISIVHKKTRTASFDVKKRELVLPIFKDQISNDLYDMFVCHEVGHSLWTPLDMLEKVHKEAPGHRRSGTRDGQTQMGSTRSTASCKRR